jgi:lysozyme
MRVLDLSVWNRKWNFSLAASRGINGCILKSSGGLATDRYFEINMPALQDSGMLAGAYHYFLPSIPAQDQAELMWSQIQNIPLGLGAWLDLEYNSKIDGVTNSPWRYPDYGERILTFLVALEEYGIRPGIYTNPSHSASYLAKYEAFAAYDLWIANPQEGNTRTVPNVPKPFWADSWRGWQYTWKLPAAYYGAPADGIKGLDGSWFRW